MHRKTEKPRQFDKARAQLQALEDLVDHTDWSDGPDLANLLLRGSRGTGRTGTDRTLMAQKDPPLNRVRLKRNMVFSWSYEKLP
jgi:AAA+ superfamily predicted ATPase